MKKIVFGLAALAAVAFALPSIASAEEKEGMMKEGKMHHHMRMHHHHHHHMDKEMKKDH
jgi:hypothetical protein